MTSTHEGLAATARSAKIGIKSLRATARVGLTGALGALCAFAAIPALAQSEAHGGMHQAAKPIVSTTLPEKPAGAHWIWVTDLPHGEYNRALLYDADTGGRLATLDLGFESPTLIIPSNPKSERLYIGSVYYSRAMHGDRTDLVEIYDRKTMSLVKEIPIPPKQIRGWPDPTLSNISEDEGYVYTQFFTPASSVGITNVKAGVFGSEVQTSGCAHVFGAGDHRLFTLCGDGSLLAIRYDEAGKEVSRKRYPAFFDAGKDPIHGSGFRSGNVWYFASHRGEIHSVDVSGDELKFLPTWSVAEVEGDKTWTPGAFRQSVAIHRQKGILYLAMRLSDFTPKGAGPDFQALDGTEVWSFDMKTHKRLGRFKTELPIAYLAVSQDDKPLVYTTNMWNKKVDSYDAATGSKVREFGSYLTFMQTLQPVD
jgi:methylamine dehydrogenase heavy chain